MSRTASPRAASTASPASHVERGHGDVPLLDGCSARFECRTSYRYDGGDHVIFVGEVVAFDSFGRAPLVFHGGNYGLLLKKKAEDGDDASSSFGDDWLGFLLGRAYYQMLMPLRADVKRQGLDDIHYNILSALSMGEGRSVTELSRLVDITGHRVGDEHFADPRRTRSDRSVKAASGSASPRPGAVMRSS